MQSYDDVAALLDAAEGQQEPFSKVVDLTREGRSMDKASHWLIEKIVPRGHVTLLGGHGGSGKSLLALTWAAHVAVGREWAGLSVCKGKVLYASLEDDGALVAVRLAKIMKSGDLDCSEAIRSLTVLDGTNHDHTLAVARSTRGVRSLDRTAAMERLAKLARSYDLVVVDNASDAFAGNENDRAEVRMFVRGMLGNMASINNQAVLLLAHIDKAAARGYAAGNNYSGSTAWHNSSRSRLALLSVDGGVSLSHEKSNLAAKLDAPLALAWTDEGLLQPSGLDCEAERKRSEKQLREDADLLESLIVIAIASGDPVTAAKGGAHTTWHQLKTYQEFPKHFKSKEGKARFASALTLLKRDGKIVEVAKTDSNRNSKKYFELCEKSID